MALHPTGIPLTVVGGFLGAGKTTLLNRLLSDADRRLAVLVNDFGAINIDAELIESRDGDSIELTNGCVCCGLSTEFLFVLAGLRDREDSPDQVVIEASGIGEPGAIAAYGQVPGFSSDAIVVVADAETVRERAADGRTGPTVRGQLGAAHLIVLNKTDLVSAEALADTRAWIHETSPYAGIVEASYGDVPFDVLLGARDAAAGPPPAAAAKAPHDHGHDHAEDDHTDHDYASWSWAGEAPIDGKGLCEVLPELPEGVMRAKGILRLREDDEHRYILQLAGRRWNIRRDRPWGDDAPASSLVVIGLPESIRADELETTMTGLTQ